MWPGSVVYPPFPRPRMWAATRRCFWKTSSVPAPSRTSASRRVGDAVEAAVDLDVIVDVDACLAPLRVLVTLGGERLERRTVQILEQAAAAALDLLERPLVERRQQGHDRLADLGQREEAVVAQRRENPSPHVLDRRLHLRLVLRRARPGGQHRGSVMNRQVVIGPVDVGFVPARAPHGRLLVVRDQELRHPTPVLEHPHV